MISHEAAFRTLIPFTLRGLRWQSDFPSNTSNVSDPEYEAMIEVAAAATTLEEQNRLAGELNMYAIERFWAIWGPMAPQFQATQPWLIGYNGEVGMWATVFARLWIDQDLKEAMGR